MIRRSSTVLFLLVALAMTGLAACDWFRPAQPEAPSGEIAFIPDYSQPESTLVTIARAIADKGVTIGASAYAGAFAESVTSASPAAYHQFFSDQDIANWLINHSAVPDWGFREEQTFYNRFVRLYPADAYRMEWAKDTLNPDVESEGVFNRHYLITGHNPTTGNQTRFLAIGYCTLKMLQFTDGNWRIVRWDDKVDPNANPDDQEQVSLGKRRLDTQ
jgi:hypothetical protein